MGNWWIICYKIYAKDMDKNINCPNPLIDWEYLDTQLVSSLKNENKQLRDEINLLKEILTENRKIYMEAIEETQSILKENRKIYNETLSQTTEILNENREIYMDAVNKIFKLEKEISEIKPIITNLSSSNNNLLNDVSEPDMISSIASRVANREWRVESKSGQIPYQAEKIKPFSLSSYLRKA
jgi:chromosome segregation ATPase